MKFDEMTNKPSKRRTNKKNSKKKQTIIIVGCIVFIIIDILAISLYISMSRKEPTAEPKKQKVVKEQEVKKIKIVDEDSTERPLAVMIDNNVGNNSHIGLQDSYINYEIIVEGGLTRIMAIFKDKDVDVIGPVRSSRHYFLDYSEESDAIYAHYGWSPYAQTDIKNLGINNINGLYDNPFWRDKSVAAPHNVFTSTDKLRSYAKTKNYSISSSNWKLLNYSADEISIEGTETNPTDAVPVNTINIQYSQRQYRSYTYNTENKYYLRNMNGTPHTDRSTSEQYHYKNLIIERVNNKQLDSEGRQDLDTVGSGEGYYITNGYARQINWTKSGRSAKTKYTYSDGSEVKVNDGNTFIQIVPTTSNITIE